MTLDRHPLSAIPTKPRVGGGNRKAKHHQNIWNMLGAMVRAIPEDDVRQVVANHFTQFFTKQPRSNFDPGSWQAATGGTLTGPTRIKP